MTDYICKNCGYRFKSAFPQKGKPCQYCGEVAIIKEPDADELLRDVLSE
ncbi:Uncharacterised protein [uncultured archaeon]|nr:Uncharacterised protein [uncultured archaeon]